MTAPRRRAAQAALMALLLATTAGTAAAAEPPPGALKLMRSVSLKAADMPLGSKKLPNFKPGAA